MDTPCSLQGAVSDDNAGKSFEDRTLIKNALLNCPGFTAEAQHRYLGEGDIDYLIDLMTTRTLGHKEILYQKGVISEYLYIVSTGELQGRKGFTTEIVAQSGDILGETEFFHSLPRQWTVCSSVPTTTVFLLSKSNYKKVVDKEARGGEELKQVGLFDSLTDGQLRVLERQIGFKDYFSGEMILKKGQNIKVLYIILKGTVRVVSDDPVQNCNLEKGDYFGDEVLTIGQYKSSRTYIAMNNVNLVGIDKSTFKDEELFSTVIDKIQLDMEKKRQPKIIPPSAATTSSTSSNSSNAADSAFMFPLPPSFGFNSLF